MNKLELVSVLVKGAGITKSEAKLSVDLFFDSMTQALVEGERVEIRGLCSFFVKEYKSYTGRNPKTGEKSDHQFKEVAVFQMWERNEGSGE